MATPGSLAGAGVYGSSYTSLQSLLGRPVLKKMIQLTRNGLPAVFPASFYADKDSVPTNFAQAFAEIGQRNLAPLTQYDSKAREVQELPIGETLFTLFSSRFELPLKVTDFKNLINFEDLNMQKMGMKAVGKILKSGITRSKNTREQIMASALFQANTWVDKDGGILPSATNAVYTANYGIPTGNTGQLNLFGSGNFLTIGWESTASAVPDLDIINLRQGAVRLTGYPIEYAAYGISVPGYLTQNARLNTYFYRDVFRQGGAGQTFIDTGETAMKLLGLTWLPAWASFYIKGAEYPTSTPSPYAASVPLYGPSLYPNNIINPNAPQVASMVGSSAVTFVPDPGECNWIRHYEGEYPIPTKWGPQMNSPDGMMAEEASFMESDYENAVGIWAYLMPGHNPTTMTIYFGDTYGCFIPIPAAIMQGTTNF